MDFNTVDAFEMRLVTGLTLVLVNLNGTGGAGALRELSAWRQRFCTLNGSPIQG